MAEAEFKGASPNAHFLIGEMPAPHTLKSSWWEGTGVSIVLHVIGLALILYGFAHSGAIVDTVKATNDKLDFIFLPKEGPGGGGGGRPKEPEPPRKAEIKAEKPVQAAKPIPKPADVPTPEITVPLQTPNAVATLPGAVSLDVPTGTGAGGGGKGTGIGSGTGSGVGEGSGGGYGGGVFQPGSGATQPSLIREVKPNYTGEAMRAKLQGVVEMECIVLPDGTVDPKSIKVTRSLDQTFGLDEEAKKAVRQWRFRPAMYKGQPVPYMISVELTFTLR